MQGYAHLESLGNPIWAQRNLTRLGAFSSKTYALKAACSTYLSLQHAKGWRWREISSTTDPHPLHTHSFIDPHCGFIVSSLCQVFSTAQHPHPWFTYHGDCSTLLPFISHYSPHSSHPQSLTSELSQRRESGEHSLTFPKPLTAPVRVAIFTSSSLFQGKGILSSLSLPSYSGSSHLPFVEALLCCHLCLVHPLPLLCLSPSPSNTNTLSSSPGPLLSPPVIPFLSSPSLPSCFRN